MKADSFCLCIEPDEFCVACRPDDLTYAQKWSEADHLFCPECSNHYYEPGEYCYRCRGSNDDTRDWLHWYVLMYGSLYCCAACARAFRGDQDDPGDPERYLCPACRRV